MSANNFINGEDPQQQQQLCSSKGYVSKQYVLLSVNIQKHLEITE